MPQNVLSATCAVWEGSDASPCSRSTIVSETAYSSATAPTPRSASRTSARSTYRLTRRAATPTQSTALTASGRSATPSTSESGGASTTSVCSAARPRNATEKTSARFSPVRDATHARITASADQPATSAGPSSARASVTPERPTPTATSRAAISELIRLAEADAAEHDVGDGHGEDPGGRALRQSAIVDERPAEQGGERGVQQEHGGRRDAQRRGRNAKLVSDRSHDEEAPVEGQHREREDEIVAIPRPEHELRGADQERTEREPAPALPEEHRHGRDQRDDHEGERRARGLAADEHRRGESPEKRKTGDELRPPANGDGGSGRTDERGDHEPRLGGDHVLHAGRVGQRRVQGRKGGSDRSHGRLGLSAPLVEEETDGEQDRRPRETRARCAPRPRSTRDPPR